MRSWAPATARKTRYTCCLASPVLPDVEVEVRERTRDAEAADQTWIAWKRVPHLLSCGPTDRCYTLDPTSGTIAFGDGVARHDPAGRAGQHPRQALPHAQRQERQCGAGAVIVLRNPQDALNEIRRVGNVEPAAGGADLEETAHVELRGPYSLKNRGRAITGEDFEWLAREITGVRRVYLSARRQGGRRTTTRLGHRGRRSRRRPIGRATRPAGPSLRHRS